jgi:hypothetical protein
MIFSAAMLSKKLEKAKNGEKATSQAFHELSETLDKSDRQKWAKEEAHALEVRGEALQIYTVTESKGETI